MDHSILDQHLQNVESEPLVRARKGGSTNPRERGRRAEGSNLDLLLLNMDLEPQYRSQGTREKVVENETQNQVRQSCQESLEHPRVVT